MQVPEIKYEDWFINQDYVPMDPEEEGFEPFWEYHKELCLHGFTIDNVFFPGVLYWHLNFWKTEIDYVDPFGKIQQRYSQPLLRDNEWKIFNAIDQAEREHKGLMILGSRRLGKALLNSSKIYLEDGTKEIGHAQIGDRIYGRDGKTDNCHGRIPPRHKASLQDDLARWQRAILR